MNGLGYRCKDAELMLGILRRVQAKYKLLA